VAPLENNIVGVTALSRPFLRFFVYLFIYWFTYAVICISVCHFCCIRGEWRFL